MIKVNKENIITAIMFLILLIPNIFVLVYFQEIARSFTMLFAYFAMSVLLWALPLSFLPKRVYFGIGFLFLLASPLEIIFVKSLKIPMTAGFIDSVYRTNFNEASEQIISHFSFLIGFLFVIGIYIFLFFKIKNNYLNKRIRIGITSLFLLFNIVLFVQMIRIQTGEQSTKKEILRTAYTATYLKYAKVYPSDLVLNIYRTTKMNRNAYLLSKNIDQFTFDAKSNNEKDLDELYILVIGETARYHNFQVNGYDKPTTPTLDTLQNLLTFSNVYSGANLTLNSVPMLITRAHTEDRTAQNTEKTVVEAFKEAGFHTSWFANQINKYPVTKRLEKICDYTRVNQFSEEIGGFYDADILPDLENIIDNHHSKKFIVIHTIGSHFRYTNRYPKEFEQFTPVMKDFGYDDLNYQYSEEIINSYDNSILYTDYFLGQIIDKLKSTHQNAVMLYVSDHGENLFDDERRFIGHGTTKPTPYEYHIPFMVWYSDKYKELNSEKVKQMKLNLNAPASSAKITFHTLMDLANITYIDSQEDAKNSISSDQYEIPEKRYMIDSAGNLVEIE